MKPEAWLANSFKAAEASLAEYPEWCQGFRSVKKGRFVRIFTETQIVEKSRRKIMKKRIGLLLGLLALAALAVPLGEPVELRVDFQGPVWVGPEGTLRSSEMLLERSIDGGPWELAERVENIQGARVVLYRGKALP